MKKILFSIVIPCILLIALCNVCYAATYQPIISAEGGNVGDTVTVTVSLPEGTGAAGGSLNLVYDNTKMELVDANAGAVLSGFSPNVNKTYAADKIRVNFAGTSAVSASGGVMLTASFKLTAAGSATVSTEKFKLADIDTNRLTCTDASTAITITDGSATVFAPIISAEGGNVGDTVTVTVSLPANTGAAGGSLNLVYDNTKMELVDASAGAVLSGFSPNVNKTYAANKIRVNFAGTSAVSASGGVMLTASFKLTAAGSATVSTEKFKLADIDTNRLTCADASTAITITDGSATVFAPIISAEGGNVGDTVTVTVSLPANTGAAGGSLNLVYDNTKMELVDASAGAVLSGFSLNVNKTYATDKIRVNFAGTSAVSASGGVMLTASFKLTAAGSATVSTEKFKLADIDTNRLTCTDASTNITITEDTTVSVTGVALSQTSATLEIGESLTLTATVAPSDATDKSVIWTSSSDSVASVVNGIVTAHSAGTATITVTTVDGSFTDTCIVTVNEEVPSFIYGDVDNDGNVTIRDAARILQYKAAWDVEINLLAADVDGDGNVTIRDAARILQYKAGWDVTLGQ